MKYWKGINGKAGQYGTFSDDGNVPDSVPATVEEYDTYVASFPVVPKKKYLKDVLLERGIITQLMYDEVE